MQSDADEEVVAIFKPLHLYINFFLYKPRRRFLFLWNIYWDFFISFAKFVRKRCQNTLILYMNRKRNICTRIANDNMLLKLLILRFLPIQRYPFRDIHSEISIQWYPFRDIQSDIPILKCNCNLWDGISIKKLHVLDSDSIHLWRSLTQYTCTIHKQTVFFHQFSAIAVEIYHYMLIWIDISHVSAILFAARLSAAVATCN